MTYTYSWADSEQSVLHRVSDTGEFASISADPDNSDYAEFLASGATAAPYVQPPAPAPLTTEEKVNCLLSDYGLTRDELRVALNTKDS